MRIEVYWREQLLYEADACTDYKFPADPVYTDLQRRTIKLEDRAEAMEKMAAYFVAEVQRKLSLMNITDPELYLIFPSQQPVWDKSEKEIFVKKFPEQTGGK